VAALPIDGWHVAFGRQRYVWCWYSWSRPAAATAHWRYGGLKIGADFLKAGRQTPVLILSKLGKPPRIAHPGRIRRKATRPWLTLTSAAWLKGMLVLNAEVWQSSWLHACCHNPSGDITSRAGPKWSGDEAVKTRQLTAFLAYQG
jgi:hypothetical protein